MSCLGDGLLKLLLFIEECYARPKRLLIPRSSSLDNLLKVFVHLRGIRQDSASQNMDPQTNIELGSAFYHRKNPDHLPPANFMETLGDNIRKISSVFRTDHAAYGLRGAGAIMTIAIIGFLRDSQNFYFRERFLWALFAILLSMGRTAGSSTFLLLGRVLGTMASMIASYIIWYIVDKKTPGILVFLWLWFVVIGYLCKFAPSVICAPMASLVFSKLMTYIV